MCVVEELERAELLDCMCFVGGFRTELLEYLVVEDFAPGYVMRRHDAMLRHTMRRYAM